MVTGLEGWQILLYKTHAADRRKITPWPYRNRALAATTTS